MIWASTRDGLITYAGPEWTALTGQDTAAASGNGWLEMLHPDDRERTHEFFLRACSTSTPFTIGYRLKRADGTYRPVVVGAAPSFSPLDGSFLGYLGALTEDAAKDGGPLENVMGKAIVLPPTAAAVASKPVDKIADYLLLARSTAEMAGEERLLVSLEFAISEVMRRLGYTVPTAPVQ